MLDIQKKTDLLQLLKIFHFQISKKLGQHFLLSNDALKSIVDVAEISEKDCVIEIGPGPGVLTREILKTPVKKVIALEVDLKVIPVLIHSTEKNSKLEIQNVSALTYQPSLSEYILIGNIPYYITSPLIRHYLGNTHAPKRVVLLIQKEVALKICAGVKDQSVLSLEVAIYGKAHLVSMVSRNDFFPRPEVDSAIIQIQMYSQCLIPKEHLLNFWKIVKISFTQKRKKIANSLGKLAYDNTISYKEVMEHVGIDTERRPQTLTVEEWRKIVLFKKEEK